MDSKDLGGASNFGTSVVAKQIYFGFNGSKGYGWKLSDKGDQAIILYQSSGIRWTNSDFSYQNPNVFLPDSITSQKRISDNARLDYISGQMRFGTTRTAGIKIQMMDNFALTGEFERNVIFPRTMFWYWTGSEVIYETGDGI